MMERLLQTNAEQTIGYGCDHYSLRAKELVKQACSAPDARVFFLVGGTQANSTVIDGVLERHEGVLAAESGHINVHESGAIEATGHKVITLPSYNGKVKAEDVRSFVNNFYSDDTYEHMVAPGMLYISFPTEYGTRYSLKELEDLSTGCHDAGIPLFIDGARLGYGLMAKGRLLGVQFETLFTDGLYYEIARDVVHKAIRLKNAFVAKGYTVEVDSPTNQQFFRLPNTVVDRLKENVSFEMWGPRGETESVVRFVTGWTTTDAEIDKLISYLE